MITTRKMKHVIWDWNGTLLNDLDLCIRIMNTFLVERELPVLTVERYRTLFDFPVRTYYERLGFDFNVDPFEMIGADFIQAYEAERHTAPLQPGARELLSEIKSSGRTQSVLSAYEQTSLQSLIAHIGLDQYFTDLTGLDHPYADGKKYLAETWIKAQSLQPDEMLWIGDTVHDAEVAASVGIPCILVSNGHQDKPRLQNTNCPVLPSLHEVKELLFYT